MVVNRHIRRLNTATIIREVFIVRVTGVSWVLLVRIIVIIPRPVGYILVAIWVALTLSVTIIAVCGAAVIAFVRPAFTISGAAVTIAVVTFRCALVWCAAVQLVY